VNEPVDDYEEGDDGGGVDYEMAEEDSDLAISDDEDFSDADDLEEQAEVEGIVMDHDDIDMENYSSPLMSTPALTEGELESRASSAAPFTPIIADMELEIDEDVPEASTSRYRSNPGLETIPPTTKEKKVTTVKRHRAIANKGGSSGLLAKAKTRKVRFSKVSDESDYDPPSDCEGKFRAFHWNLSGVERIADQDFDYDSTRSKVRLKVKGKGRAKANTVPVRANAKTGTTEKDFEKLFASPLDFYDDREVPEIQTHESDDENDEIVLHALERKWAPNRQRRSRKIVGSPRQRNSASIPADELTTIYVGNHWGELGGKVQRCWSETPVPVENFLFEGSPLSGLLYDSLIKAGIDSDRTRLPREPEPCPFKEDSGCKYLDNWDKDKNYPRHAVSHLKGLGYFYRCPEDGNLCLRPDNFLRHSWTCRGAWILGHKRMHEIYRSNLYVV
jgi:hypothetical protein